jgi:GxxExxY protein
MAKYVPTIGLEIHVELKTATKMFCDCPNDPEEKHPNVNVCPICLGHPGVLPVINKKAVEDVIKIGLAVNGEISEQFKFDRKNYFYPDLPKGYQISQYDMPVVKGGFIDISTCLGEPKVIKFERVHLEEDAGKLMHSITNYQLPITNYSLVDFNRGGVPLMELVTEPDMHSAKEAAAFAKELQLILRYLEISDADLEKGQMRVDVNISIRPNENRIQSNDNRIILKEESYRLMGLLFEVHNKLGSVYKEKNYQDAIEAILRRESIPFERERNINLKFDNLDVGNFFADFVIDGKILLEIKATKFITQEDIRQTLRYIKSAGLPLGIIVNFRSGELKYKQVINPKFDNNSAVFEEDSGAPALGTKAEIKNLNSFAALEEAINYEVERQSEILNSGKEIKQETRGWDDVKKITISQRSKEEAHDYRYFPEPDLPPLDKSGFDTETLKLEIPELPFAKRKRFKEQFGLNSNQVNILVNDRREARYFEEAVSEFEADEQKSISPQKIQLLFNYLNTDLRGLMKERELDFSNVGISAENFADLIEMLARNEISSRVAKDLILEMMSSGSDPKTLVENKGLAQVSDEKYLLIMIKRVLENNPTAVADYKKGKTTAIQFLIGKAMAELKGRGNPAILRDLFEKELK